MAPWQDDEDTKVRRNLVAFSSALLALAWLNVPLSSVLQRFGVAADWQTDPWRIWSFAGVTLFYLAARFQFSGGGKDAYQRLGESYVAQVERRVMRIVFKIKPPYPRWWAPSIDELVSSAREKFVASKEFRPDYEGDIPEVSVDSLAQNAKWLLTGKVHLMFRWMVRDPEPGMPSVIFADKAWASYSLPHPVALKVRLLSFWSSWIFSGASVSLLAPVWLSLAATSLVFFRLGSVLF